MQSGRLAADSAAVREALASQLLEVWLRLRWLASARGKLRDVRRLMEVEADTGAASSTRPLLRQVLGKVLLQVSHGAASALELLCGCCVGESETAGSTAPGKGVSAAWDPFDSDTPAGVWQRWFLAQ